MATSSNPENAASFWRVENEEIIVSPPRLTVWSKFRLGLSVVIAMIAGAFAVMVAFHPEWFHLPASTIAYLGAGALFFAAIIQMLLMVTAVFGALAIVRGNGINVRGKRYPWSRIKQVLVESDPAGSADSPTLTLVILKRGREKKVTMVPAGLAQEKELTPLARRIEKLIQQFAAKKSGGT